MSDGICPFALYRPVVNQSDPMGEVRGFIPHVQVGYGSLFNRFNTPSVQASSNFWTSRAGDIEQYVSTRHKAWAEGAGNFHFVSNENEGMDYENMTDAQIDANAKLIRWLLEEDGADFPVVVNLDPEGWGITPHNAGGAAWGGHSCPGPLRQAQYPDIVSSYERLVGSPAPIPPQPSEEDMDVFYVMHKNDPAQRVFLASVGGPPRYIRLFGAGATLVNASPHMHWGNIPGGGKQIIDGAGGKASVWVVDDDGAWGFGLPTAPKLP